MSDLNRYIGKRSQRDEEFAKDFESGYESFKIGVLLKQARLDAGMTQEQIAEKLGTKKTAISRMENHAQDVRLSTIEKYVNAIGKKFSIRIA